MNRMQRGRFDQKHQQQPQVANRPPPPSVQQGPHNLQMLPPVHGNSPNPVAIDAKVPIPVSIPSSMFSRHPGASEDEQGFSFPPPDPEAAKRIAQQQASGNNPFNVPSMRPGGTLPGITSATDGLPGIAVGRSWWRIVIASKSVPEKTIPEKTVYEGKVQASTWLQEIDNELDMIDEKNKAAQSASAAGTAAAAAAGDSKAPVTTKDPDEPMTITEFLRTIAGTDGSSLVDKARERFHNAMLLEQEVYLRTTFLTVDNEKFSISLLRI